MVAPGQVWLMTKDNPYSGGYDGDMYYLVKSKEPDTEWICIVFQLGTFGGYERFMNEEEIQTMKYLGHITYLKASESAINEITKKL